MERLRMVDCWTGYVRLTSRRDVAWMSQMRLSATPQRPACPSRASGWSCHL